jgi:hypothetical protein
LLRGNLHLSLAGSNAGASSRAMSTAVRIAEKWFQNDHGRRLLGVPRLTHQPERSEAIDMG